MKFFVMVSDILQTKLEMRHLNPNKKILENGYIRPFVDYMQDYWSTWLPSYIPHEEFP